MNASLSAVRGLIVTVALLLAAAGMAPRVAQASGYLAEITTIDLAGRRLTLKASMGELTVRVAPGVTLEHLKPGDKVSVTFGQDGTEPVVTHIEVIKP